MLGRLYVSQKKLDRAVAEFETMAKQDPKSQAAHTMVAVLLEMQGKIPEAQQRYRKVLQLNPRSAVAANNLAWLYADQGGDLDTALQLAQTAKEQLPDDPAVNDTLGWIYYKKDQAATAIAPLKACVDGDPKNVFCHYHLGLVYAKAGDAPRAKEALEAALKISPSFDGASDARVILASMR
jgi:Tfp pilus assembly protein PilF